jgi:hypothetical protein
MEEKKTYLNNPIYSRDLSTLNDLLRTVFVENKYERQILNSVTDIDNFNELRLKMYFVYTVVLPLGDPVCNVKYLNIIKEKTIENSAEFSIWLLLSNLVQKRESTGFPLVYKYNTIKRNNIEMYNVAFEFNSSKSNFNMVYDFTFSKTNRLDQIKFQKLLISYMLFKNRIYYDYLYYNIYNVPKFDIIYKINDLYFNFETFSSLVILSCKSNLIYIDNNEILEKMYINNVLEEFRETTDLNFIEYFIVNFGKYIDMAHIPFAPLITLKDSSTIDEYPQRGDLVKIKIKERDLDKFYYGILADYYDNIYKIYILSKGIMQIEVLDRFSIYKSENILPILRKYTIGKSNCKINIF